MSPASEVERIARFTRGMEDRSATRSVPFEWGTALWHDDLPRIWDLNFLRLEHGGEELSARHLAETAERLQGASGLEHRKVASVDEGGLSARLDGGFKELGWTTEKLVTMVHRRQPHRTVDRSMVREVGLDELGPSLAKLIATMPYGSDPETIRQLMDRAVVTAGAVTVRHFAAPSGGELAGFCDLYLEDGIGQIEDVGTLEEHRGKGLATAVVIKALDESEAGGHDLTFLVADDDDWPKEMYRKLGFDPVALSYSWLKLPARPGAT